MNPVLGIVVIYTGIIALIWVSNRWLAKLKWGAVGLILIVQPVATTIYDPIDPRWVLAAVLLGLFVLLIDVSRQQRNPE